MELFKQSKEGDCYVKFTNKVICSALLAAGLSFAHSGIVAGGTEGLRQINAQTLGQWNVVVGTGGTFAADAWAFTRGGGYEVNGSRYAFDDYTFAMTGDFFVTVGLLDFLDLGLSIPLYYDHAQEAPAGSMNMWTVARGDLNINAKVRAPLDTNKIFSVALLLDAYVPTGETQAGVRPRHAWYLNGEDYTHPYTANSWAFGAGLAFSLDFTKKNIPIRWNIAGGAVIPLEDGEAVTLEYSSGLNFVPLSFVDFFLDFSGEMRLQSKGDLDFAPFADPMLLTPGMRFHVTRNIDLAMGLDVAVRTLKNLGFDYEKEVEGCSDVPVHYQGEDGRVANFCYAPTPLWAGAAMLTIRFGGAEPAPQRENPQGLPQRDTLVQRDTVIVFMVDTTQHDFDQDGVVDSLDKCPNTPQGVEVDSAGCPKDTDKDGVPDSFDKCPNTAEGVEVDSTGCPKDSDSDGIFDTFDKCPNTAQGTEVDSTGCPKDTDKDGVPDMKDKCPNTPDGAQVDSLGCLPDFDKDGVPDNKDKCPNTLQGVAIDTVGCPLNKKENLDELKKGIQFKLNSAKLTTKSYGTLDDIARLMKKFPNANLEVQGHTDDKGTDEYNMQLSQKRAQAVMDYLITKGIDRSRLRAVGYGRTMPIASNNERNGREKNRRVEMVPFEK
ncbi:MAG: OmpA family protein [Fibrobacter sp.]|nr:OmpA family protein [Fibrobacter sp.]